MGRWILLAALGLVGCASDSDSGSVEIFSNRETGEISSGDGRALDPPFRGTPAETGERSATTQLPATNDNGLFVTLPLDGPEKLEALSTINDPFHSRSVTIRFRPPAFPRVTFADGTVRQLDGTCAYGIIEGARRVSVPTGSNHLLMEITLGDPEAFPTNYLACDYASGGSGPDTPPTVIRLEGCFYVRKVSVPTARLLDLAPLPGPACGLY